MRLTEAELAIRNGSERSRTAAGSQSKRGRVPVLSDEALLATTRRWNQQRGRPPTAPELIAAAGGCQRQRALRAIRQLRAELAEVPTPSVPAIPDDLRHALDAFAVRVLERAATERAEQQAQYARDAERQQLARDTKTKQRAEQIVLLRRRLADAEHLQQELLTAQRQLRTELEAAHAQTQRAAALAEERQRLLDTLLIKPASRTQARTSP